MEVIHARNPDRFLGYAGIHNGLELQQHILSLPGEDLDQLASFLRAIAQGKCQPSTSTIASQSSPIEEAASVLSPRRQGSNSVIADHCSTSLASNAASSKSPVREKESSGHPVPLAESPLRDTTSDTVKTKQSRPVWKGSVQFSLTEEDDGTFTAVAKGISRCDTGDTDSSISQPSASSPRSTLPDEDKNPNSTKLVTSNKPRYHHTPSFSINAQTIPTQGHKQEKFAGLAEALSNLKRSIPGTLGHSSKMASMALSILPSSGRGRGFFSSIQGPKSFIVGEEDNDGGPVYITDFESSLLPETPPGCDYPAAAAIEIASPDVENGEKYKSVGGQGALKAPQDLKGVKRSTKSKCSADKGAAEQVTNIARAGTLRLQDAVDAFVLQPGATDWDYRVRNPLKSYEDASKPITQEERDRHIADGFGPTYAEFLRMDPGN
ncbi:hypothetical protein BU16DRAFT_618936 [Lophium mytilinum]|uniref:Uncharacterized protein n=1 Tax=Lophium mytilinum TaxID=390894 RepID=A0A6A6QNI4_9PEZI|nr:hypothetical protein BU16DRAFT_618936 [Lophium mytilinum]